uniref:non-specific serine/threonine protein kinase n=1 Tax=Caenorhabditis tropicalis TaxID=1561998 RepID=A0A1I7TTZ7_9PELO
MPFFTEVVISIWAFCSILGYHVLRRAIGMKAAPEGDDEGKLETKAEREERIVSTVPLSMKSPIRRRSSLRNSKGPREEAMRITLDGLSPLTSEFYTPSNPLGFLLQAFKDVVKIGSGGLGDVFSGISREDGKKYAIKMHKKSIVERNVEKYKEAETFLSIPPHQNLLKFYGAWRDNGHVYIQTELCRMDLSVFSKQKLSGETLWTMFLELLAGLNHLHSNGWIHNDLKTENILISMDGRLRIGDIGLSTRFDEGMAVDGDGRYLAREVLTDKRTSMASDVFSLGIILLELATNIFLPENGSSWHQIRNGKIPERFFKGVAGELKGLILQMIHSNPDARPTCKELMEHPIIEEKRRGKTISLPSLAERPSGCSCFTPVRRTESESSPPRKTMRISTDSSTPTRSQGLRGNGIRMRPLDFCEGASSTPCSSSPSNHFSFRLLGFDDPDDTKTTTRRHKKRMS